MGQLRLGAERKARASALRQRAAEELAAAAPEFLTRFPLEPYIAELDHHGRPHRFWDFTEAALAQNKAMAGAYPQAVVEIYNRLLLAHLVQGAEERGNYALIGAVQPFVLEDFDRILKSLERPRSDYYLRDNHLFRRDLAIARLKVFPNGFELYDTNVAYQRRMLLKEGPKGPARFAYAFGPMLLGPLSPLFEPHWDRRYVKYFSADEYERCCLRVADMLSANPSVKGIAVQSWWYDPQLEEISPELWFVREVAERGGARFILLNQYNPHLMTDALAFSPARKAAHEEGRYNPRNYLMVWPRGKMIAWAARTRAEKPGFEAAGLKPAISI